MRDQYEKQAMMQELESDQQKKEWLKEANKLFQESYRERVDYDMLFTTKDYYDAEGRTPKQFLDDWWNEICVDESDNFI